MKQTLTQERLKELLYYNQDTGNFIRKVTRNSTSMQGQIAGNGGHTQGYITIGIDGEYYAAHKLAFLYMENTWPDYVDHKDTIESNNAWHNLRAATCSQNRYNSKIMSNNSVGVKGISFVESHCPHYRAGVKHGSRRYRKCFSVSVHGSKELALQTATTWVEELRQQLHGEFANHG